GLGVHSGPVGEEVDGELLVDVLVGGGVERADLLLGDPAVVEGAVEAPVQLVDPVDGGVDARAVGEVELDRVGDTAGGADLRHDACQGGGAAGGEHDGRALRGEEPGGGS